MKRIISFFVLISITFCLFSLSIKGRVDVGKYNNSNKYTSSSSFSYSGEGIKKVDISWIYGDVTITTSNKSSLKVEESYMNKGKDSLHYYLDGDTLYIKFGESGKWINSEENKKNLKIEVPSNIILKAENISGDIIMKGSMTHNTLDISTVSGDIEIERINTDKIKLSTTSGDIKVERSKNKETIVETVSGDVEIEEIESDGLSVYTASGEIEIEGIDSLNTTLETLSGDIELNNVNSRTFTLKTISGYTEISYLSSDKTDIKTTSGNVRIKKDESKKTLFKSTSGKLY